MRILGLSAFYHDSAAALIEDGRIVAAAQEERFTRRKHDPRFPALAIGYCLAEGETSLADVDRIVFYEKPFLKFERLLETYVAFAPRGIRSFAASMPVWLREKLFQKDLLVRELKALDGGESKAIAEKLLFSDHHMSHAASAFYPSPFEESVVLTMDGVGEWPTMSVAVGRGRELTIDRDLPFPHSLGLLYSAFTYYTGFKVNSGEYKLMGLAPYGEPRFADLILDRLVDLKDDGTFRLDLDYFDYCTGLRMTNRSFDDLFGRPARKPSELLEPFHMDVAASIQDVTNRIVLQLTRSLADEYEIPNICLAGGVALNCVANGEVLRDRRFENLWIQPAAGDAGGAIGAALAAYHLHEGQPRDTAGPTDRMAGAYLGPAFDQKEIERRLIAAGAVFETSADDAGMIATTAGLLAGGAAIGWFQGRMEFGPRALGGRSILADPRRADTQKNLNLKVKFRESFRPFAPSVLAEKVSEWFDIDRESPYMLLVAQVAERHRKAMTSEQIALFGIDKLNISRSSIPAVTHIDYSARIQTVEARTNPLYHRLLTEFEALTGCPVLVNTSFNVRSEPIVCTPEDAFRCLMGTDLDALVIGRCIVRKADQDPALKRDYSAEFEAD